MSRVNEVTPYRFATYAPRISAPLRATTVQVVTTQPTSDDARTGFRADIQGLRAIGVAIVVLFHARIAFAGGGYVGVDVFFVLSGYLISALLVREAEQTGRISLIGFIARRARRLLPAAAVMTLTVLAVSWWVLAPTESIAVARLARASALYVSNLWMLRDAMEYFSTSTDSNPLIHTWSLSVEEQFYICWPLLVALAWKWAPTRTSVARMMTVVGVCSLVAAIIVTRDNPLTAFYGTHLRAWEFAVGGLAQFLPRWPTTIRSQQRNADLLSIIGLTLIVVPTLVYSPATLFPGLTAIAPTLGTALILVTWSGRPRFVDKLLSLPAVQRVGDVSYSWYLWHWPVLVFAGALTPNISLRARLLAVVLSYVAAECSYRFIEHPLRSKAPLLRNLRSVLVLAFGVTAISTAFSSFARAKAITASLSVAQAVFTIAINEQPPLVAKGCLVDWLDSGYRECVAGDTTSKTTVVLMGDSHAGHWTAAFDSAGRADGWKLVTIMRASCPIADVVFTLKFIHRRYVECESWRGQAIRAIRMRNPSVVVFSFADAPVRGVERAFLSSPITGIPVEEWGQGLARTAALIADSHIPILMLRDTPRASVIVPRCLARSAWRGNTDNDECQTLRSYAAADWISNVERRALGTVQGTRYVDLTNRFCGTATCIWSDNGAVVYRDDNHLTAAYSMRFVDTLRVEVHAMLEQPHSLASGPLERTDAPVRNQQ